MYRYTIEYYQNGIYEDVQSQEVNASNKADAYDKFMRLRAGAIYSAWVAKVTYKDGTERNFNTFSGNPY